MHSHRNQSIDLQCDTIDCFLHQYEIDLIWLIGTRDQKVNIISCLHYYIISCVLFREADNPLIFTCSKTTIETLQKGVNYVQS